MSKYFVLAAATFLVWVTAKAWGFPAHVFWFSLGACATWVMALGWAIKQPTDRTGGWHHDVWVLVLATLFWWSGEALALRLGKYQYESFPLRLPLSGTPGTADALTSLLNAPWLPLPSWWVSGVECMGAQTSWAIPFPVIALEAALVFTMFRISVLLFEGRDGRAALATGGLSAVLFLNATVVLDPVVSTTQWCGSPDSDPNLHGLMNFPLWHWFTNETHPGYWFGVPLVNYASWFLAALTFGFWTRKDDEGGGGFARRYKVGLLYIPAGVVTLLRILVTLLLAKLLFDWILIRVRQDWFPVVDPYDWQLGWMAFLLLVGGFVLIFRGRGHEHPEFKWVFWVPQLFVFAFCWGALILEWHWGVFAVGFVTTVFLLVVIRRPGLVARPAGPPLPEIEPGVRV